MKRAILLATAALLLMLVVAPVALAQETTEMPAGAAGGKTMAGGRTMMGAEATGAEATMPGGGGRPLAPSGGPAILLPAAALLLGSGILTYSILRRR
jgi:hypothetical protein